MGGGKRWQTCCMSYSLSLRTGRLLTFLIRNPKLCVRGGDGRRYGGVVMGGGRHVCSTSGCPPSHYLDDFRVMYVAQCHVVGEQCPKVRVQVSLQVTS